MGENVAQIVPDDNLSFATVRILDSHDHAVLEGCWRGDTVPNQQAIDSAVGTGFLASERYVITCAHVVAAAVCPVKDNTAEAVAAARAAVAADAAAPAGWVLLEFPVITGRPRYLAKVVVWHPVFDSQTEPAPELQDIAVLELQKPRPEASREMQLTLVKAEGQPINALGFPRGYNRIGLVAGGKVQHLIGRGWHQLGNFNRNEAILPGFSGSAVWAPALGGAVGMMVAADVSTENTRAYCIPAQHLSTALGQTPQDQYPGSVFTVPSVAKPLVGRDDPMRQLRKLLLSERGGKLHIVTGLPGAGKTAFTTALANDAEIRRRFREGILWIGLGQHFDAHQLLGEWCSALGVQDFKLSRSCTVEDRKAALRKAIGDKRMLLVIDDAKGLQAAQNFFVGADNCTYIITTQNYQEWPQRAATAVVTALPPLSPEQGLAFLKGYIGDGATGPYADSIRDILRDVLGLPLALLLLCEPLTRAVESGDTLRVRAVFEPLRALRPGLDAHQTNSAAFAVCHGHLEPAVREALQNLSVLPCSPNSFSTNTATQLLQGVDLTPTEALDQLVDAHLLTKLEEHRYAMHPIVADYAGNQEPAAVGREVVEKRMVEMFVRFAETHKDDVAMLDLEYRNIFSALHLANEHRMRIALLRGINALGTYLERRGLYDAMETHFDNAEIAAEELGDTDKLITTLWNRGRLEEKRGAYVKAAATLERSLELTRRRNAQTTFDLLLSLSIVAFNRTRYEEAEAYLLESLRHAAELKDNERLCRLYNRLGLIEFSRGHLHLVEKHVEQARAHADLVEQNDELISLLALDQGRVALKKKDYDKALWHAESGITRAKAAGSIEVEAALTQILGRVASENRDFPLAEKYLSECLATAIHIGHRWYIALFHNERGKHYLTAGRLDDALLDFRMAYRTARKIGCPDVQGYAIHGMARVADAKGDDGKARKWALKALCQLSEIRHYQAADVARWIRDRDRDHDQQRRASRNRQAACAADSEIPAPTP